MNLNGDQIASLLYLVLLGAAVGGWMMVEGRQKMGQTLRMAAIWVFIFLGAIAIAGLWGDIRNSITPMQRATDNRIEMPRAMDNHFYLTLTLNGVDVGFMVDTGATDMVLTRRDAKRIGIDPDGLAFLGQANTANGTVETATIWIDKVQLGPFEDTKVRASVNNGEMERSLLGMSYLSRFDSMTISGDKLVLER